MVNAFYAIMRAFAYAATIAVVYKYFLEYGRNIIINQMVHDPVAEICGKNLTFHRAINNKAYTWLWYIPIINNVITQIKKTTFKMLLKCQGVNGVTLVFTGIKVCREQIYG